MKSRVLSLAVLAGVLLPGCGLLAEQLREESLAREPEMERVRGEIMEILELGPHPRTGSPDLGKGGGDPTIDGSQRYVLATGRLDGDLPQATQRVPQVLESHQFHIVGESTDQTSGRAVVVASIEDFAVRITLFEEGNPSVLPAQPGMVYAHIEVALNNSAGSVLRWTHVD